MTTLASGRHSQRGRGLSKHVGIALERVKDYLLRTMGREVFR